MSMGPDYQYVNAPIPVLLDKDLTVNERLVYLYLLWRQGNNDSAWPAAARIAEDLGLAVNTVKKAISHLRAKGHIVITPQKRKGRGYTNHYSVVVPKGSCGDHLSAEKGSWDDHLPTEKGSSGDPFLPRSGHSVTEQWSSGDRKVVKPWATNIHQGIYTKEQGAQSDRGGSEQNHPGFEQFWSTYPRQQGKGKARRVWDQLNPSPELAERIVKSVKRHKESEQWQKDNGQYIPSPAKYLEEERWDDELEPQDRSFGFTPRMPTEDELTVAHGGADT